MFLHDFFVRFRKKRVLGLVFTLWKSRTEHLQARSRNLEMAVAFADRSLKAKIFGILQTRAAQNRQAAQFSKISLQRKALTVWKTAANARSREILGEEYCRMALARRALRKWQREVGLRKVCAVLSSIREGAVKREALAALDQNARRAQFLREAEARVSATRQTRVLQRLFGVWREATAELEDLGRRGLLVSEGHLKSRALARWSLQFRDAQLVHEVERRRDDRAARNLLDAWGDALARRRLHEEAVVRTRATKVVQAHFYRWIQAHKGRQDERSGLQAPLTPPEVRIFPAVVFFFSFPVSLIPNVPLCS